MAEPSRRFLHRLENAELARLLDVDHALLLKSRWADSSRLLYLFLAYASLAILTPSGAQAEVVEQEAEVQTTEIQSEVPEQVAAGDAAEEEATEEEPTNEEPTFPAGELTGSIALPDDSGCDAV